MSLANRMKKSYSLEDLIGIKHEFTWDELYAFVEYNNPGEKLDYNQQRSIWECVYLNANPRDIRWSLAATNPNFVYSFEQVMPGNKKLVKWRNLAYKEPFVVAQLNELAEDSVKLIAERLKVKPKPENYLISNGRVFKIGFTEYWGIRYACYCSHNPDAIFLLVGSGSREKEKQMHEELKKFRLEKLHVREWFAIDKADIIAVFMKYVPNARKPD